MVSDSVSNAFISGVSPASSSDGEEHRSWWFAFRKGRLLVKKNDHGLEVPLVRDIKQLDLPEVRRQFLGTLNGRSCYSVELTEDNEGPNNNVGLGGWSFQGLRRLYLRLPEDLFWVAGRAIQIVDWDRNSQYCGRCGAETHSKQSERAKECPQCGLVKYPRISPAIIVLVEKENKLLLARAHRHPPGFYSVLAGFVEPGETLEMAVAREIREEVGIEVKEINYFGSQPWPYPDSLMIAFTCTYAEGEIRLEEDEIEDAGWYSAGNLPPVPPKISIARQLIDWFVARKTSASSLDS
jgi:NAD+ diphosphatase